MLQQIKKLMQRDQASEWSEDDTDKGAGAFEKKESLLSGFAGWRIKNQEGSAQVKKRGDSD